MKKIGIAATVLMVVLGIAWAQEGEEAVRRGAGRFGNMSEEQRERMQQMRERFQNMSEEERAEFREQMRQRMGGRFSGRRLSQEQQVEAIEAIEKQAAKLKEIAQNFERPDYREMSEAQRNEFREKMAKAMAERRKAIETLEAEVEKLKGPSLAVAITPEDIQEMRAIHKLAVEEKAEKTADRMEELIAKFTAGRRRMRPVREGAAPVRRPDRPNREGQQTEQ